MPTKTLNSPFKLKEIKTGRIATFDKFIGSEVMHFERYEGRFNDNGEVVIYRPWDMRSVFNPRWVAIGKKRHI